MIALAKAQLKTETAIAELKAEVAALARQCQAYINTLSRN